MSGLFRGSQMNWACLTKDAYAIYMSIKKLAYYLEDANITLRSDHLPLRKFLAKNTFNYVWILCNRTDFNLLLDKLSQPNMAASSGLSGKMFFPATWNFNILNDINIAMIYYPFDIIAL